GKHFLNLLLARPTKQLPWSRPIIAILVMYSLVSVYVWGFFLWRLLPSLWSRLGHYHHLFAIVWAQLAGGNFPMLRDVLALVVSTFLLVISLMMVWRLGVALLAPALTQTFSVIRNLSRRVRAAHL